MSGAGAASGPQYYAARSTMPSVEPEIQHTVGGPLADRIDLAAVEAAILKASNIEEWYREELLAEVRSLSDFYREHVR